jgi:hypothetical protein
MIPSDPPKADWASLPLWGVPQFRTYGTISDTSNWPGGLGDRFSQEIATVFPSPRMTVPPYEVSAPSKTVSGFSETSSVPLG